MTENQLYVKNHPETLGLKMDLKRMLKDAERGGDPAIIQLLKDAIGVCDNPPHVD